MRLHAEHEAPDGAPITSKVEGAVAFARRVAQAGANYFRFNPTVALQLRAMGGRDRAYLAHEFFGEHWRLTSFGEIASQMREADLNFAATAFLLEHVDRFALPPGGAELLNTVSSPVMKETLRESFTSPQFRQDIFVKGPVRSLSAQERLARLRDLRVMLTGPVADTPMRIPGPLDDVILEPQAYRPVLEALAARDYAPKSIAELEAALGGAKPVEQLIEELTVLVSAGCVGVAQDAAAIEEATPRCNALNRAIWARAREGDQIGFLASPVLGAGVAVHRFVQLFLLAMSEGKASPKQWAEYAWARLEANGERIMRQGRPTESAAEGVAMLTEWAQAFEMRQLPILRAIGVAPGG
jgi:hypothetical protein